MRIDAPAITGSFVINSVTLPDVGGLATTGSNTFGGNQIINGTQTVNGNLIVTGSLTAQQYIISNSVTYLTESFASGSHVFGNDLSDTHQFTGSIYITGSLNVNNNTFFVTGSNIAIGTSSPNYTTAGRTVVALDGVTSSLYALQNAGTSAGYVYGDATSVVLWAEGSRNLTVGVASAGTVVLKTNNTAALTIGSNQAVTLSTSLQINTTGRSEPLAVKGIASTSTLNVYTSGLSAGTSNGAQVVAGTNSSDFALAIYNQASSPYFYIRGDGNTGVRTTSPTVTFQVNGSTTFEPMVPGAATGSFAVNSANGLYGLYMASRSNGDTWMQVGRNDGTATAYNLLLQTNGGSIGIGTNSPSDILDVRKNQNATTNFYFRNTDTTDANSRAYLNVIAGNTTLSLLALHGADIYIAGTAGRNMIFQQNPSGTVNMVINSSGNFGFATTTVNAWSSTYFGANIGGGFSLMSHRTNSDAYLTSNAYWNGSSWLVNNSASIHPTCLQITDGFQVQIGTTNSVGSATVFSVPFTVTNAGRVGINTTTPSHKLEISGNDMAIGGLRTYIQSYSAGAGGLTGQEIIRQFHDSVNWDNGGILVEIFFTSYQYGTLDYGVYFARYGYGNSYYVETKVASNGNITAPSWGSLVSIDGRYFYGPLQINVPAYIQCTVRMTTTLQRTYSSNTAQSGVVYLP